MVSPLSTRRRSKTPPPGETGQEALYLRSLSDRQITVQIKLRDGETVRGWIEYFDDSMVRLTREGHPNLFIYKHQIRSISEAGKKRAAADRRGAAGPRLEWGSLLSGTGSQIARVQVGSQASAIAKEAGARLRQFWPRAWRPNTRATLTW